MYSYDLFIQRPDGQYEYWSNYLTYDEAYNVGKVLVRDNTDILSYYVMGRKEDEPL